MAAAGTPALYNRQVGPEGETAGTGRRERAARRGGGTERPDAPSFLRFEALRSSSFIHFMVASRGGRQGYPMRHPAVPTAESGLGRSIRPRARPGLCLVEPARGAGARCSSETRHGGAEVARLLR